LSSPRAAPHFILDEVFRGKSRRSSAPTMPACSTGDRASGESKAEAAGASSPYPRRERGGRFGVGAEWGRFPPLPSAARSGRLACSAGGGSCRPPACRGGVSPHIRALRLIDNI